MSVRIKYGFSNLSVSALMLKSTQIIEAMTGNANFVTPNPALADVQTALDELIALAQAALNRDKLVIAQRNAKRVELENLLKLLAAYVINVSNNDPTVAESSGFDLVSSRTPIGMLPPPQNLRLFAEDGYSGQLKLDWDRVHGASSYVVEQTTGDPTDPNTTWEEVGRPQKSRFFAEGLAPGTVYSYRIIPLGAVGLGGVSDAASKMAA